MSIEVEDIAAIRIRPDMVLLRSEPHQKVDMNGSTVDVAVMESGLVVPVSGDKNNDRFMHETRLFIERCGHNVEMWEPGMRVYLKDHPEIVELCCAGVAYKLAPASAIRIGLDVVEVAV